MPAKRPLPLSDAALGHKGEGQRIGETNDGMPLPVKNTFIDMPGFSPNTPTDGQPVSTAPAQVHYQQGFVKRAVLDAVEESAADSQGPLTSLGNLSATPLMTPSPTGTSFSDARYQLFGGPMPLKEVPALRRSSDAVLDQALDGPAYGAYSDAYGAYGADGLGVPGALGTEFARMALGRDSDDEDADSEAERQQALLAASGRTVEDAPKPPPGTVHPSMGSASHESGSCKRCCFYPRNRCLNGYECEFCHYEHEKRKRKNKKNKKKKAEVGDMEDFLDGMIDHGWPAQMPPGQMPPGHLSGHMPPGHMPPGQMPLGHMPPAHVPPGHMPGHMAGLPHFSRPGEVPPGQAPPQVVPEHVPPGLSYHPNSPFLDAPLTYQWTDGIPGQTPAPPIIHGYEEYVAACCSRRLPGLEPPALATNPPPQAPQAQAYRDRQNFSYEAPYGNGPSIAPGSLDPSAAPWVPSQPATHNQPNQPAQQLPDQASQPSSMTVTEAPAQGAGVEREPCKRGDVAQLPQEASLLENVPPAPPDSSPKLSADLVASHPPPPDQSPTLPT